MTNWLSVLQQYTAAPRNPVLRKVLAAVLVTAASLGLANLIAGPQYTFNQFYMLWLTLLAIGLWVTEAVPAFAVGLFIIGFQVLTLGNRFTNPNPIDTQLFTNTIANPIIWLILGGFFLAGGLRKTGLDQQLLQLTLVRFGPQPKRLLLGIMLTTMALSMVMSNTATTAMMLAMVMPFLKSLPPQSGFKKSFVLGVPIAATLGGMGTLIGSPPNAIAAGVLAKAGYHLRFTDWIWVGLLPAVILTLAIWWALSHWHPAELLAVPASTLKPPVHHSKAPRWQRWVVQLTLLATALGWLTASLHHIPVHLVAMLPVVVFPMVGVITATDFNSLNWDTLILVAGGLSLGSSIIDTGLADRLLGNLSMQNVPAFWVALLFGYIAMACSNVISNTAAAAILIPLAIKLVPQSMLMVATSIALSASCALLLPVSTPPNAIAMSTGFLKQSHFTRPGLLIGLAGPLLITLWLWIMQSLHVLN